MPKSRFSFLTVLAFALVALWLIIAAFPFLWTIWGSFKVQGDFFSKADWMRAITGEQTIRETGSAFTLAGYYGAWVEAEFWKNAINTLIVVFFKSVTFAIA